MPFNNLTIGQRIAYYRKKHGLKQKDLAPLIGTKPKYLSDIEHGRKAPNIGVLALVAATFEITLEELMNGGENNENHSSSG